MPRPGTWMVTLRGVMGFLLAGAVVWLVFVLAGQIDSVSLAIFELGLLGLSFFLWLRQRAELERRGTGLWWLLAAATAVALIYFAARATPAAHSLQPAASARAASHRLAAVRPRRGRAPLGRRPARLPRHHRRLVRDLQGERAPDPQQPRGDRGLPRATTSWR